MGRKKEETNLAAELQQSYERWEHLWEHGGSDPFYADGCNMNLVRNHIIYYKQQMIKEYGEDYGRYPESFYRETPPEVKDDYIARAGKIRDGAAQALEYYLSDPNFRYLLANKGLLDKKEAEKISLNNVLGYASGLAAAIRDGDLVAMRRHADRPESYLESFAGCAAKMQQILEGKRKEPEQIGENEQLSLFQLGILTGQCR